MEYDRGRVESLRSELPELPAARIRRLEEAVVETYLGKAVIADESELDR